MKFPWLSLEIVYITKLYLIMLLFETMTGGLVPIFYICIRNKAERITSLGHFLPKKRRKHASNESN